MSLTLVTQHTLPPIRAETNSLQWRLWDACGSMTAGAALTGAELTQSASIKRGALTEPALSITENEEKHHQVLIEAQNKHIKKKAPRNT